MRGWQVVWVTIILLLAAIFRILYLDYGQPEPSAYPSLEPHQLLHDQIPLHPDEFLFVTHPLRMLVTRQFNPKFFENPSFLINLNLVTFWVTGTDEGIDHEIRRDQSGRFYAPFHLYIIGRVYSVLGGMLAVASTMALARLFTDKRTMLIAGVLAVVCLPLVQHAHYATTSSLATGFATLAIWFGVISLRVNTNRRWWFFFAAAVCTGLATGNRYNAGIVSVILLGIGAYLIWQVIQNNTRRQIIWVLSGWLLFPLTFLVTTPHAIFDTDKFLQDLQYISTQYLVGYEGVTTVVDATVGLLLEYGYLIVFALGILWFVFALMGSVVGLRGERHQFPVLLLLSYIAIYSVLIIRTVRPNNADHLLLPIIPVWIVIGAMGYQWMKERIPTRWRSVLAVISIAIPLITSTQWLLWYGQPETRYTTQDWVRDHLPQGSSVYLYGPYNVPLDVTEYDIEQDFAEIRSVDALQDAGFDYVIYSDAQERNWVRFPGTNESQLLRDLQTQVAEYQSVYTPIFSISQPPIIGNDWTLHSASYWHHPGLTVYCLTEESCASVAQSAATLAEE